MTTVSLLCSACNSPIPTNMSDFGAAYNHVRDSLGIKMIPSNYVPEEREDNNLGLWIDYTNPKLIFDSMSKLSKAYYLSKTLRVYNDTLFLEVDNYILMRYPTPNQRIPLAILSYLYYHNTNRYDSYMDFDYMLYASPENDTLGAFNNQCGLGLIDGRTRRDSLGELLPMTRAEADSILATWGMKYP